MSSVSRNAGQKTNSMPIESLAYLRVHIDSICPLKVRSAHGKKYIMVMTDTFSKYTKLAAIEDKQADSVAKAFFESWIVSHGVALLP